MVPIEKFLEIEKRFELEETEIEEEEIYETFLNFQKMFNIIKNQYSGKALKEIYNAMKDDSNKHFVLLLPHPSKQIDSFYLLRTI